MTRDEIPTVLKHVAPLVFVERDYYDRYIRDDAHLQAVVAYIENNPVKAGLIANAHDWPFGSACRRSGGDA